MGTRICEHQEAAIGLSLHEAEEAGALFEITKADADRLELSTFMPTDLNAEQRTDWIRFHVKTLFKTGEVARRCAKCGHRATGDLLKCSADETRRINKFIAEAKELEI